ncbi:MAG: sigma 54-interacting transcriptional regulator [Myxococcota bacterium]
MDVGWIAELRSRLTDRRVDLDALLRAVVDEATRRLGADRGTLYLVDHARSELVSRVAHLPEIAEIRLKLGEGVAGHVASTGEVLNVPRGDGAFADRIDAITGYRTRSLLAVPLRDRDGVVIAVLQLLNKRPDGTVFDPDDERHLLALAAQLADLLAATSLRSQLHPSHPHALAFRFNHIVGGSPAMRLVYDRTDRAARTEATVLVRGESGTGKELIARAIHDNSTRRDGPFVKVDCAALPESLVENELFGHERGAFTGADRPAEGKVHAARGGTLFLDEIGELPLAVQGKLLRLFQDRTFVRVGGTRVEPADVRIVSATHRALEGEASFRRDLYYRVRVVEIVLPPLRERGHDDLDRLVDHFLFELGRRHGRPGLRLSPAARAKLHGWHWPGNVRELENRVEAAVVLATGPTVEPDEIELGAPTGEFVPTGTLAEVELAYIRHVLARCGGNRTQAAKLLDISRNTLARKLGEDG